MMQLHDFDSVFEKEDCHYALRALEIEAYSAVVSSLRAQGSLSQYYHLILEHLRLILNISLDRHKAEVRRVLADPVLSKVANGLNPKNDVLFEWTEEAKRTCGNGNFASSLSMESPAFYRFNFLRSSKNDALHQLADRLALLAVEHNRSKSLDDGEEQFFQALKKPKSSSSANANRDKKAVADIPTFVKNAAEKLATSDDAPPTITPATTTNTNTNTARTSKAQTMATTKRKSNQKETPTPIVNTPSTISAPATNPVNVRKNAAGRPRKRATEFATAKQRVGQIIAARSAQAIRGNGRGAMRGGGGRGGKKLSSSTQAPILVASPQRPTNVPVGQQNYYHPQSPPFYQFYGQPPPSTMPRTPPRQTLPATTPPTSPVVNNQPGGGQKSSTGRHYRKRTAFVSSTNSWPTLEPQQLPSRSNLGVGSRVPVAPLSVMLPASTSATFRGPSGSSRFYVGPSSPTRPLLTGEAPGVYADDYNANSMDATSQAPDLVPTSPSAPMQPHHFFSSLSATYFAQNPSTTPTKTRRISTANFNTQNISAAAATEIGTASKFTGITVKAKSGVGATTDTDGGATVPATKPVVSLPKRTINLPMHRVDPTTGQKVIVLPSSIIRRAQQQQFTQGGSLAASSQQSDSVKGAPHQSLIIVRRASSMPSATAVSTSTTPSMVTPPIAESQEEAK